MSIDLLLNGPVGMTLGWTLIHLLWQATAVALILGAIRALWPSASSNVRYTTAILALVVVMSMPALTFAHLWQAEVRTTSSVIAGSVAHEAYFSTGSTSPGVPVLSGSDLESSVSTALPWLVAIWLTGVFLLGLRLVIRIAWTARLTRDQLIEVEGSWHRVLGRLTRKLRMRRVVALYESGLVDVPTVVGWLKPVILVPTSVFTGLTYRQIETVLAHELAHVRRHDALVNFLQSMVETLFFFHPAIWWISGRIRIEREHCCDDVAIAVCGDRVAYAKALTFLEEMRSAPPANALAATGGNLLERIRRIAGVDERDRKTSSIAAVVLLLTLGAATAWAAASAPQAAPDARFEVSDSGWWYESIPAPPDPPAPPAPPEPPAPFAADTPVAPAPPEAPPAPPAPMLDEAWMDGVLAEVEWLFEGSAAPEPPAPPAAPPQPAFGVSVSAPPAPRAPRAPRIASIAPEANEKYVLRGKRMERSDRKIGEELTVDELIALRSVGASPEYLRSLRALGFDDLTLGEVVSMRGVGVSPDYVVEMQKVFGKEITPREIVRLKAVGVSSSFVSEIRKQSGRTITVEDAIRLRGVGVSPEWIRTLSRVLGSELSLEDAIRLRGVGVSEEYIAEMQSRGFGILPADDLIRLRGVGVTGEFIDSMKKAGYAVGSIDELVRLRGVGVDPEFVADLRNAGFPSLDIEEVVALRGVGVTADYVRRMRAAGFSDASIGEFVQLRALHISPEYVESLREAGLKDLTVDNLVRMKAAGIDADYIRQMRQ